MPFQAVQPVIDYVGPPVSVQGERREDRVFVMVNHIERSVLFSNTYEIIDNELWETEISPRPENE